MSRAAAPGLLRASFCWRIPRGPYRDHHGFCWRRGASGVSRLAQNKDRLRSLDERRTKPVPSGDRDAVPLKETTIESGVSTRRPQAPFTALTEASDADLRIYDLGRPLVNGMPQSPNHPEFRLALQRRHGDMTRADGSSAANELIVTGGHVGTHIDALAHVSYRGYLHGQVDASAAQAGGRFSQLGAETIKPIICRGLLLDVAAAHGSAGCPAGYEIMPADLDAAVALTGTEPRAGDVLLIRSGWGARYGDRAAYIGLESGVPGPGEAAARWMSSRKPRAVGADTIAFECLPPGSGHSLLPVHRHLLVEAGIYIIEVLDLEELAADRVRVFTFVLSPLKIVGGTGSPTRPLAVISVEPTS
jgi:kynurenine formamidase